MDFALDALAPINRYKLLSGLVVPRPIAWVTTLGPDGRVNAAPYSFFNLMGSDPPVVALGPQVRWDAPEAVKDTPRNLRAGGAFVVNVVDEAVAPAMHRSSAYFPPEESEVEALGLATAPSVHVDVPRIAAAPAAIECREHTTLFIGRTRVVLGVAVGLYVRDDLVDPGRFYIAVDRLGAVGRMGGGRYVRTDSPYDPT